MAFEKCSNKLSAGMEFEKHFHRAMSIVSTFPLASNVHNLLLFLAQFVLLMSMQNLVI